MYIDFTCGGSTCLNSVGYLFLYLCLGLASDKDISFAGPISRSCQCSSEDLLEKIIKKQIN